MVPTDRWVQYYRDLLTENRVEYERDKNISPTQMDGETVEVSEEMVRKAVRELKKWEIMWTRRKICGNAKTWNR